MTGADTETPQAGPAEDAGHPFLAFVNTVTDTGKSRDRSTFATATDLQKLLASAGMRIGTDPPAPAQMASILALREAAFAMLSALAAGRPPGREDALQLEAAIKTTLQDSQFGFTPAGLDVSPGPLGGLHDHLVLSLYDLLQSPGLDRLRECRRCTHLFLDHGRGTGRRWCSMSRCGNRAKAEAFRARKRAIAT